MSNLAQKSIRKEHESKEIISKGKSSSLAH